MKIIGITGPTGAGKTTALHALADLGGPRRVFVQVHAPAKNGFQLFRACGRELCEAVYTSRIF